MNKRFVKLRDGSGKEVLAFLPSDVRFSAVGEPSPLTLTTDITVRMDSGLARILREQKALKEKARAARKAQQKSKRKAKRKSR